jgi:thioredoxin 1
MKIIKFYKNGCAPCKTVEQYLESKNIPTDNVNIFDDPDAAFDYSIMSVPVTILLNNAGLEIYRVRGFDAKELDDLIGIYKQG